jgi:hypothetical protein
LHLDGRTLHVSSGRPCSDGDVLLVPGEGMPVFGSPWQKGDLFVNISVSMDSVMLLGSSSHILLLPPGGDACSSPEAQGFDLQFAPDALGSGIVLQERRLRDSDASHVLLLPGDNITVGTHPLSHRVLLYGIDVLVRGSPSSVIMVHVSCVRTNGDTVASLLQLALRSPAPEVDAWRTLHFASRDAIVCPASARVSLQVSPFHMSSCASDHTFNFLGRFRWQETAPSSCSSYIFLLTPCSLALLVLPPLLPCASFLTTNCWSGWETTAATACPN